MAMTGEDPWDRIRREFTEDRGALQAAARDLAERRSLRDELTEAFDPNEPRDENGQWTDGSAKQGEPTRVDSPQYRKSYTAGWSYSIRGTGGLDYADRTGKSSDQAWMDGYLDAAAGREKWHRLNCHDHGSCGK